jgi:transcription elongation factor GreA
MVWMKWRLLVSVEARVALTAEGIDQLSDDLVALRERRENLAEQIAASPFEPGTGVLTEMALADRRIAEIEALLSRAKPIDQAERIPGVVGIGSRVTVRWDRDGEETYTIVDPAEIAPELGRISHESPAGQALFGRRAGDRVAVETLGELAWLEVIAVS